jgi:hypothetical protein
MLAIISNLQVPLEAFNHHLLILLLLRVRLIIDEPQHFIVILIVNIVADTPLMLVVSIVADTSIRGSRTFLALRRLMLLFLSKRRRFFSELLLTLN